MQSATAEEVRDLRRRVLDGEPYTVDELRKAIATITNDRVKELQKGTGKASAKRKAPVAPVSLDDLL